MADASRDNNNVPTLIAVSSADGVTPVRVYADPTTHRLLTSSSAGATAPLTLTQATLGNSILTLQSTASNSDPSEVTYQQKVLTTDGNATTLATIAIPATTTVMIEARVVARRTGGSAGVAEDGATYIVAGAYKNVAGTATEIGEGSLFSAEDQAGWACTLTPSSGNVLLQVTGATNNNVSWSATYRVYSITS